LVGFAARQDFSAGAARRYRRHEPDLAMLRASLLLVRSAAVIGMLAAVHAAVAGERGGDRRTSNTFVVVVPAPEKPAATRGVSSNGATVAPSKPVVTNPYQVPLLHNAGSLRATR
jgi:hypothetical protein